MDTIIEYKNHKIEIVQDNYPESPRDWDNLFKMICFSSKYNLGDKHTYSNPQNFIDDNRGDFIIPLYAYIHSGISLSLSNSNYPYNDMWDAGQVGYMIISRDKIKSEYNWKYLTRGRIRKLKQYAQNEIDAYNQYLNGDVYGFQIYDNSGEMLDSCWGFYGDDYCLTEAKSIVDFYTKNEVKDETI